MRKIQPSRFHSVFRRSLKVFQRFAGSLYVPQDVSINVEVFRKLFRCTRHFTLALQNRMNSKKKVMVKIISDRCQYAHRYRIRNKDTQARIQTIISGQGKITDQEIRETFFHSSRVRHFSPGKLKYLPGMFRDSIGSRPGGGNRTLNGRDPMACWGHVLEEFLFLCVSEPT